MSVLLTVNNVSHNPALEIAIPTQHGAVLIIFPLNLQTFTITRMLSSGGEGRSNVRYRKAKASDSNASARSITNDRVITVSNVFISFVFTTCC